MEINQTILSNQQLNTMCFFPITIHWWFYSTHKQFRFQENINVLAQANIQNVQYVMCLFSSCDCSIWSRVLTYNLPIHLHKEELIKNELTLYVSVVYWGWWGGIVVRDRMVAKFTICNQCLPIYIKVREHRRDNQK